MKGKPVSTFYVYEHWRPDTNSCFYVGKGHGRRARDLCIRGRHHRNIKAKLARADLKVEVRMVAEALTETEAFETEKARITYWRTAGVHLCNRTDGGEGTSGYKYTAEQRAKLSTMMNRPEVKAKHPMIRPEVKARHSAAIRAAVNRPEVKAKISGDNNSRRRAICDGPR